MINTKTDSSLNSMDYKYKLKSMKPFKFTKENTTESNYEPQHTISYDSLKATADAMKKFYSDKKINNSKNICRWEELKLNSKINTISTKGNGIFSQKYKEAGNISPNKSFMEPKRIQEENKNSMKRKILNHSSKLDLSHKTNLNKSSLDDRISRKMIPENNSNLRRSLGSTINLLDPNNNNSSYSPIRTHENGFLQPLYDDNRPQGRKMSSQRNQSTPYIATNKACLVFKNEDVKFFNYLRNETKSDQKEINYRFNRPGNVNTSFDKTHSNITSQTTMASLKYSPMKNKKV